MEIRLIQLPGRLANRLIIGEHHLDHLGLGVCDKHSPTREIREFEPGGEGNAKEIAVDRVGLQQDSHLDERISAAQWP